MMTINILPNSSNKYKTVTNKSKDCKQLIISL